MMSAEMMRVVSVMPEMGVFAIMAMAQAETDAKRKAMTRVTITAIVVSSVALGWSVSTEKRK